MFEEISKAHKGGLRAGRVEPRFYIPGGERGLLRLSPPLNPYSNPFILYPRRVLALVWEGAYHTMRARRLARAIYRRS